MKSQLNKYRQYTISDYLINTDLFKDYLHFCLEHNLKREKKYLMDNLLRNLQIKEKCGNQKLLSELRKLCMLLIIFSDFEVELLFEMNYLIFNPEFQKKIFYEVKEYLNNNNNGNDNNEIKTYINNKFYYWLLKLSNQNFSSINEIKDTILVEKEVKEGIDNLLKYINNINIDIFNTKKQNEQIFIIKIIYELSLYKYFKGEDKKTYKFLNTLVTYYDKFIQKSSDNIDANKENKIFYFDINDVKALIKYYENNENEKENNMIIDRNENDDNIFDIDDINNYENILSEDFDIYKNEIDKAKNNYNDILQLNNTNSLNEIDYNNKINIDSILGCLKLSEYLIYKANEDYSYYKMAYDYANVLQNKLDEKIKNNNRNNDNDLKKIKKELFYHKNFLDLIDKVSNKKEKLDKSFLENLADFISKNALSENLRLNGLIHSYITNFGQSLKRNCTYFSQFMEFFVDKNNGYKKVFINQIVFIDKIMKLFYEISETKNKQTYPFDKEPIVNFDENFHLELIKIFLYWLSPKDDIIESQSGDLKKSSNKKSKRKYLKYCPSQNILFILIESLQNWEFLKILKIIYLHVLKLLINFKNFQNLEFPNDLLETIYQTKSRVFKINSLFDDIIKNFRVIVDETNYSFNIKLKFKEKEKLTDYGIKEENINLYIKTLFNLIQKIDKKILYLEQISQYQINDNDKNNFNDIIDSKKHQFLFSFFYSKEINIKNNKNEIKKAIIFGIDYFKCLIYNYKNQYMKLDLMNDSIKLKKNYEMFKLSLDQDVLYQLIICFIKEKKFLESIILIQYSKKFDKNLVYKLLKNMCEKNDFINFDNLKYIWKITIFEYLSNFYYSMNNIEAINKINALIKRISNHQYFKGHSIRKNFKILNFFNFLDYLNNIKYNI